MQSVSASAPAKAILFGEHAVVYGRPAIAVPLNERKATVTIVAKEPGEQSRVIAPQLKIDSSLNEFPPDNAIRQMLEIVISNLQIDPLPPCKITIDSSIPISAGLGSGAAISVALIRAISKFLEIVLPDDKVSLISFEMEKIHHGTPSGIDNTVIAFGKPILFQKDAPFSKISLVKPLHLVVAGTGTRSNTREIVSSVRESWSKDTPAYEAIFDKIGALVNKAHAALKRGSITSIGKLMNENQGLLKQIGVSSPELEKLISAALESGALGAKLTGAGNGGNIIAIVKEGTGAKVLEAVKQAGAVFSFSTVINPSGLKG